MRLSCWYRPTEGRPAAQGLAVIRATPGIRGDSGCVWRDCTGHAHLASLLPADNRPKAVYHSQIPLPLLFTANLRERTALISSTVELLKGFFSAATFTWQPLLAGAGRGCQGWETEGASRGAPVSTRPISSLLCNANDYKRFPACCLELDGVKTLGKDTVWFPAFSS